MSRPRWATSGRAGREGDQDWYLSLRFLEASPWVYLVVKVKFCFQNWMPGLLVFSTSSCRRQNNFQDQAEPIGGLGETLALGGHNGTLWSR